MERSFGYLISGIGVFLLVLSIEPVYSNIELIQTISSDIFMVLGVILAVLGVAITGFIFKKGKKRGREVPIYQGKEIIGYRRV